ncbi:hypothetical protein [Nostoc sp. ChiVER01]|uniref:hypothetical protein n=1 Tax=Nostoc sp. ChiVER01 TaxID=3075382 RepID=UPI002AD343E2|nr:hypothetical protein [Nostoc sp. ChiVER01]
MFTLRIGWGVIALYFLVRIGYGGRLFNPNVVIDYNHHRQRTEKCSKNPVESKEQPKPLSLSHSSLTTYQKLQETLKEAGLYEVD